MKPEVLSPEHIRHKSQQLLVFSIAFYCLAAVTAFLPLVLDFPSGLLTGTMGALILAHMCRHRQENLQETQALLRRIENAGTRQSAAMDAEPAPPSDGSQTRRT